MPTSILAPTFRKEIEDIIIIGADEYYLGCQLKKAQVFAISIKDLEFQAEKKAKPETNPNIVVSEEYYNLLDVCSEKNIDTFPFY